MKDIWMKIKEHKGPIVLYGTGNGADILIDILKRIDVEVSAIFASPTFVRSRYFHDIKVESYDAVKSRYGSDMLILMAFGTHDREVIEYVKAIDRESKILIPDLLLDENDEPFSLSYLDKHYYEFEKAYERLSDDKSREIFKSNIEFRLTGELDTLLKHTSSDEENWKILNIKEDEDFFDCGAYNGDTVERFLSFTNRYNNIYAAEVDPKTYKKLVEKCQRYHSFHPFNLAISDKESQSYFSFGKGRGNSKGGKQLAYENSIDNLLNGRRVSIIKYDIEGEEEKGLLGARESIKRYKPRIVLSSYHRIDDIFKLPKIVSSIRDDYSYYLRRSLSIPAWELDYFII